MIWRGPMVISAIKTLTQNVLWDNLDIIIDMPPGTGDTNLTFAQDIKVDGAIIISTPKTCYQMSRNSNVRKLSKNFRTC